MMTNIDREAEIEILRASADDVAATIGVSRGVAFDALCMPDWVWAECSAAAEAAGPRAEGGHPLDLFAGETPARRAASDAAYAAIRAAVIG